ncbi:MAG: replication-associated recombination protein A [Proteobacteria bacterium]|nr:replication-associated recombination protein A [Pseudomonadota bacterium]
MDLFQHQAQREQRGAPLAARMRPARLEEFFGQEHLLGPGRLLQRVVAEEHLPSLVLWGPPGSGKTTLARLLAEQSGARFVALSAVGAGVKELRATVDEAAEQRDVYRRRTVLFIDELHRFNKAQQDALLPHVEAGTVVLIGATTENPSFEVNAALLSRVRVLRLEALAAPHLVTILRRALASDAELRTLQPRCDESVLEAIAQTADGDARRALTTLEIAANLAGPGGELTLELAELALQRKTLLHDKQGDQHYAVVSAFIKSLRGSDPDAAVYWMARMLEAGEDPVFVVRRMVIFAAEDVGNADPQALGLTIACLDAVRLVGLPEALLPLTQACTYLATAPKSNSALTTYDRAREAVHEHGPLPVPLHLRNAPTALARAAGHGRDYRYPHDYPGHHVAQQYLPDALIGQRFYQPSGNGREAAVAERLARLKAAGESAEAPQEGPDEPSA